jgi:iron complex outermembrane receptor protein
VRRLLNTLSCGLALLAAQAAGAQTADLFRFFAEEAQVVSASRIPQSARQAPATVYVVTGEELTRSGATTVWDALRAVPGVDVMTVRAFQGSVSIRGLNKALNSRTLVLVDGRSTTAVSIDYSFWENLPVLPEEIERIEVVEGPASALYGANAINGVINIVTKQPAQLGGSHLRYGAGERRTHEASLLHGRQQGRLGYRAGVSWRRGNSFEDPDERASQAFKATGYLGFDLGLDTQFSLSGGRTWMDTEVAGARFNRVGTDGSMGFLRLDGARRNTRLRLFWNTADIGVDFRVYSRKTSERHDVWDLNLEQLLHLSGRSTAVVGGGFRALDLKSSYVAAESSLWSLFGEHQWRPAPRWTLWSGARLDARPGDRPALSPRLSLTFAPAPAHVLRLSAGAAYRNPTLLDRRLSFRDTLQLGELEVAVVNAGNPDLKSERIRSFELAHQWEGWGGLRTRLTGFGYRLDRIVLGDAAAAPGADLQHLGVAFSYRNGGSLDAWGGEAGLEAPLGRRARAFANYSYQDLRGVMDPQAAGYGTPHHKVNGGLRWRRGWLTGSASCNWVSRTLWSDNNPLAPAYREVPGYTLVNLHLSCRFARRFQGLALDLNASNLFDKEHYETLPGRSLLEPGQSAEIAGSRRNLSLSYQF